MNLAELHSTGAAFYNSQISFNILSGPGVGKTSVMGMICATLSQTFNEPFGLLTTILSGMDPVDIRGFGIPTKNAEGVPVVRFTQPSVFPDEVTVEVYVNGKLVEDYAKEHGIPKRGILFFDEFAQCDADIQKTAAQIILDRRISNHKLPKGWVVWSAGNRTEDKAGVVKTLAHVQNRRCDISVEPDYEAWQKWAFANDVHPLLIGFAKSNAGDVFRMTVPKEQGPYCTPRSLVMCGEVLKSMRTPEMNSNQLPDNHIAAEAIKGLLGEGIMPKFLTHIRLANDLPDVDDVIKSPDSTPVPERLDARFVMATSLAVHAAPTGSTGNEAGAGKRMKAILKYVTRMDLELQTLFMQATVTRNAAVLTVAEFAEWTNKNQKLLMAAHS